MSDRIEGGNATIITFSSDAPPEIVTRPTDREIIAALVEARADADFCAKSWESEITANNALRGVIAELVEALEGARAMLRRAHFVIEQLQNSETMTLSINAEIRAISAALKLAGA